MHPRHSRDDARKAKLAAAARFYDDADVTSVGIGMTADRSDYAVTITVASARALKRMPVSILNVPTRVELVGETIAF